ncbi:hypothetical protein [Roseomonas sp. BN140053]|uniref:hypothetical protein n=1 Tax=Roseomonas sp. BN140053 TaxID=3391898 RepID=UPI0039E85F59
MFTTSNPIAQAIDEAVCCVRCGSPGLGRCGCWIHLRCPRCDTGRYVERQPFDPAQARELLFPCGRHQMPDDVVDYRDGLGRPVAI